ncbi:hypothetical protein HanPSC8_Chr01g0006731 [Helianthus annuus]|nr:hypothetical protein HanPSC8_Chr01g0006731 [Helianthus annuus]
MAMPLSSPLLVSDFPLSSPVSLSLLVLTPPCATTKMVVVGRSIGKRTGGAWLVVFAGKTR